MEPWPGRKREGRVLPCAWPADAALGHASWLQPTGKTTPSQLISYVHGNGWVWFFLGGFVCGGVVSVELDCLWNKIPRKPSGGKHCSREADGFIGRFVVFVLLSWIVLCGAHISFQSQAHNTPRHTPTLDTQTRPYTPIPTSTPRLRMSSHARCCSAATTPTP